MIECPVCLHSFKELKSGSHVIPRWAMNVTKEGVGSYSSIDLKIKDKPRAFRIQSDLKCDFWCENCENRFAADDANGAFFFRDRRHLIEEKMPNPHANLFGGELHNPQVLGKLRSFAVGLMLRCEVYSIKKGKKPALGNRFPFYAKAHKDGVLDEQNCSLVLLRNIDFSGSHFNPVKTRFGNRDSVMMMFCGYEIFLISDEAGPEKNEFSNFISSRGIFIPIYERTQMPHSLKMAEVIEKIRSRNLEGAKS